MEKRAFFAVFSVAFALFSMEAFAADVVKIGAIFAVTGPNANLGTPEARTLQMLVDEANAAGGIAGKRIELIIKDSQGNTEKAVSYAKQLTEENEVLAIVGPSTSGESVALKSYMDQNEQILISCAAGEAIVNPLARWVFKVAPMDSFAAQMIYATMKKMGISRIGVLSSNSGFGQGGKAQLEKLAPSNGITIAISEIYDKEATDLTSVLAKIKAQDVQGIVNWSTEPAQSIVLKNIKQLGITVPVFQSHGFGNIAYATAAGKAAEGTLFPCGRILVADVLPASHAQKKVLVSYRNAYMSKFKEEPSTFGGHAYDSFQLIVEAVRKVGTDKYKVRDFLEGVTGLVGTAGVFNFSPTDHNGLTIDAFEMLTVKNGQFTLMKQ